MIGKGLVRLLTVNIEMYDSIFVDVALHGQTNIGSSSSDRITPICDSIDLSRDFGTFRSIHAIYLHRAIEAMTETYGKNRGDRRQSQ